jgi:hypothetical protein
MNSELIHASERSPKHLTFFFFGERTAFAGVPTSTTTQKPEKEASLHPLTLVPEARDARQK